MCQFVPTNHKLEKHVEPHHEPGHFGAIEQMITAVENSLTDGMCTAISSTHIEPSWTRTVLLSAAVYKVAKGFRHKSAADRPDYIELATLPDYCHVSSPTTCSSV